MCNAWNHSSDCTCGWGGVGHLGRRSDGAHANRARWPVGIPPVNGSVKSVTMPNAACPVCGEPVFYYYNEYGSSVFFDELGPPWPKHPCTDRVISAQPVAVSGNTTATYSRVPGWSRNGWFPAIVDYFVQIDNHIFKLTLHRRDSNTDYILYGTDRRGFGSIDIATVFRRGALVFVRAIRHGLFAISALDRTGRAVNIEAFDSQIELHERMPSVGRSRVGKRRPKKSKGRSSNKSQTSPPAPSTSMSEAFKRAIKNSR